jgi:hypothetical protein
MKYNPSGRPQSMNNLVWPAAFLAAGLIVGFWFELVEVARRQPLWLAALALTVVFGLGWFFRIRAARRLRAAMDAHAEREIAFDLRWNRPKRTNSRRNFHARPQSQTR